LTWRPAITPNPPLAGHPKVTERSPFLPAAAALSFFRRQGAQIILAGWRPERAPRGEIFFA